MEHTYPKWIDVILKLNIRLIIIGLILNFYFIFIHRLLFGDHTISLFSNEAIRHLVPLSKFPIETENSLQISMGLGLLGFMMNVPVFFSLFYYFVQFKRAGDDEEGRAFFQELRDKYKVLYYMGFGTLNLYYTDDKCMEAHFILKLLGIPFIGYMIWVLYYWLWGTGFTFAYSGEPFYMPSFIYLFIHFKIGLWIFNILVIPILAYFWFVYVWVMFIMIYYLFKPR